MKVQKTYRRYLVSNGNRGIKSTQQEFFEDNSGLRFEDRLRLYAINTNGNHLDGSGGPELNFYRVGSDNWITGDITKFSDLIGFGLSTSVAVPAQLDKRKKHC
ncbi:MAG: hypothetical protein R2728_16345 [Chitinophagales bacterium]